MNDEMQALEVELDTAEKVLLPTYVPTIEETFKASGAHRQAL